MTHKKIYHFKHLKSVARSPFRLLCHRHHQLPLEPLHLPTQRAYVCEAITPHFLLPPASGSLYSAFCLCKFASSG